MKAKVKKVFALVIILLLLTGTLIGLFSFMTVFAVDTPSINGDGNSSSTTPESPESPLPEDPLPEDPESGGNGTGDRNEEDDLYDDVGNVGDGKVTPDLLMQPATYYTQGTYSDPVYESKGYGIRFNALVNRNFVSSQLKYGGATFSWLVLPKDYLTALGLNDDYGIDWLGKLNAAGYAENEDYLIIQEKSVTYAEWPWSGYESVYIDATEYILEFAALTDILYSNVTREFFGLLYMTYINEAGETVRVYASRQPSETYEKFVNYCCASYFEVALLGMYQNSYTDVSVPSDAARYAQFVEYMTAMKANGYSFAHVCECWDKGSVYWGTEASFTDGSALLSVTLGIGETYERPDIVLKTWSDNVQTMTLTYGKTISVDFQPVVSWTATDIVDVTFDGTITALSAGTARVRYYYGTSSVCVAVTVA